MSTDPLDKIKSKPIFPAVTIRACLEDELIYMSRQRAELVGVDLPKTPAAITALHFPIDSLSVVEILCKVDELVGFDTPQTVVRAGGYNTIDQAIDHLMPRIEKVWLKQKGKVT